MSGSLSLSTITVSRVLKIDVLTNYMALVTVVHIVVMSVHTLVGLESAAIVPVANDSVRRS